jgi:manganese oxidase
MTPPDSRRKFLLGGSAVTLGAIASAVTGAESPNQPSDADQSNGVTSKAIAVSEANKQAELNRDTPAEFEGFSRYHPSFGGPPDSDRYLGKLVPGLGPSGAPPVPFEAPDLEKIPWKMVDGRKEFHIYAEPVRRELLPGNWMNFYGYNGSMPGPTIEATQGDRVRFVVHNRLPEPTTVHWHGLELPIEEDGVPGLTQNPIKPGDKYVYEFDLHQAGTFFYHAHVAMQESFGTVGFFIIHPKVAWDPVVDRDFGLLFQNFMIRPNTTIPDSFSEQFNWHTINGRSGPYTTPMVVKHGERVRIRILNFSPIQHHPIHLHGHTFWITGREGARLPSVAWQSRNTELIGVAQAAELEFVAFNPGDWLLHCHMFHHMMNHMTIHAGPRMREGMSTDDFKTSLTTRPAVDSLQTDLSVKAPGYPQMMQGTGFTDSEMKKIDSRRETRGMREKWHMGVKALMTVVRVLPEDLYDLVMNSDEPVEPGQVFKEIARRQGDERGEKSGDKRALQPRSDG